MTKMNSRRRISRLPTNTRMYDAVVRRDDAADGVFCYGVVTTGVYCRPSCASRTPNAGNVRYFPDADAAETAGFRACKRCRPDAWSDDVSRISDVARYIEAHADESLPLAVLAERAGLSAARLQKKFKSIVGVSPKAFQDAARLGRMKDLLKSGDGVAGAIFGAGFGSLSRVYGEAARNMGMTPAAYRKGGEGETIYHAFRESALGPLLMAATARGVCFAQFGDGQDALLDQLRSEFPNADLVASPGESGPDLDRWIEALDRHLADGEPRPELPLDLRGTAFQLKVWRFLLSVADGDTLSYGELAKRIGRPAAARAAASACGRNRIAVLVPCHRVLRGNGELGGYRWGLDRKRALLDVERRGRAR